MVKFSLIKETIMIVNISEAKNNLPIADLVIHKPTGKRTIGLLEGKLVIPEDFDHENTEINEMFYGNIQ